jgi:hypothetical protein
MSKTNHNLDIKNYSLDELFGLFDLPYNMSLEQLKQAKKRVLMLHPDKSKLSADYFLFYKKAFEIVVKHYENHNKQNQEVTEENTQYKPIDSHLNKSTVNKIKTVAGEMNPKEFQNKFNQLFEDNMVSKSDNNKNDWFKKDEPVYDVPKEVSAKNIGQAFENIKKNTSDIVQYRGVKEIKYSNGSRLYDEEDEDDDVYVTSDPFSKLKFDDLRKVHKDQTIFAVSESDYSKVPQYSSVDHFVRERSKHSLDPLEKQKAEEMLDFRNNQHREKIMRKEHVSNLRTMEYEEKNKKVISSFLQIGGV